jgi:hypothetical protein
MCVNLHNHDAVLNSLCIQKTANSKIKMSKLFGLPLGAVSIANSEYKLSANIHFLILEINEREVLTHRYLVDGCTKRTALHYFFQKVKEQYPEFYPFIQKFDKGLGLYTLNFQKQFVEVVEKGAKCRTIRVIGSKAAPVAGQTLRLYTGQRTKLCKKIKDVLCKGVTPITFSAAGFIWVKNNGFSEALNYKESLEFAKADGFLNTTSMIDFFKKNYGEDFYKLQYQLIEW